MSTQLIESEALRFLSSSEPEVICLTGRWGVGKTFAWRKYVQHAKDNKQIALERYSYVSLFGINSLDALKYTIFENTVRSSGIGIDPSLETLRSNALAVAERLGRRSVWFLQQIPRVTSYVGSLAPAWFLSVRNTVICIDDIERRGANLTTREVLGLASMLKEQRGCKLALVLNADALDTDAEEFRKYYEKVVDISLDFAPTPTECAAIAFDADTKAMKWLAGDCVKLGISNIRLMKRIERSVRTIETLLEGFDELVLKQCVDSLALLGWSLYEPSLAPSTEYLVQRRGKGSYVGKDEVIPVDEAAWNALLDTYGFRAMDSLDLALLSGIKVGYFDSTKIRAEAAELNKGIEASRLNNSFFEAWELFHNSLEDNQDEVLDAMHESFLSSVKQITPLNMNSTIVLFKALGRQKQAKEMIDYYLAKRGDEPGLFDPHVYLMFGQLSDPDVDKAFNDKHAALKRRQQADPAAILRSIAETNSWSPEQIATLADLPTEQYYRLFKETKGYELRKLISSSLQFARIGNATPEMQEVLRRAREALTQIGKESPINARRLQPYGIQVDATESPAIKSPDNHE
jgi:hypothetical protein